ncbi:MAG: MoaD/ThiS family protein [SAR202 cluster bacterium]|jgi:molybdopterin converting factor small subunit|nr:MoaD/ThiS family protein [SAR202 cluster bacterium]
MSDPGKVEIQLYGALRRYASQQRVNMESVVWLDIKPGATVGDALQRLSIADSEVSNIFHNGRLAADEEALQPGDRLGVFPANISLLYC